MTNSEIETIQRIAGEIAGYFRPLKDDDGKTVERDGVEVVVYDHNAPHAYNVDELVREAHGGMFPDDWRYSFIVEALYRITEYEDMDDAADEIDADAYNIDLLRWLSSHLERASYVDEAVRECGIDSRDFDTFNAIGLGQAAERREVFHSVRAWIETVAADED